MTARPAPGRCGRCGTTRALHWHCQSPTCTWVACETCRAVTDLRQQTDQEDPCE